jgi:hypothetical protein
VGKESEILSVGSITVTTSPKNLKSRRRTVVNSEEACLDPKHSQETSAHGNSTNLRANEVGKNAKRTPDWLQRAVLSKFLIAPIVPRI